MYNYFARRRHKALGSLGGALVDEPPKVRENVAKSSRSIDPSPFKPAHAQVCEDDADGNRLVDLPFLFKRDS